jgi:hypothetical protein
MGLKEFFKFTRSKLIIVIILAILNAIFFTLTVLSTMDVTSNASNIMTTLYSILSPFQFIEGLGILFNLITYYIVACILIWISQKIKSK